MVLQYETNVDDIRSKTESIYQQVKSKIEDVVSQEEEKADWTSVWGRMSDGLGEIHNRLWLSECLVRIGPSAEVRKAYSESSSRMKSLKSEIFGNPKLFQFLKKKTSLKPPLPLSQDPNFINENYKFIKEILSQLERNGSCLEPQKLEKFKEISSQLSKIENQFLSNIGEDNSKVLFTEEELEGLPVDFIKNLKEENEGEEKKRIVTMKYPHIVPILKKAKREETRKRGKEAMDNRVGFKNVQLLKEAILKREELAHLLDFKTWADYRLQVKMPQNPAKVEEFSRNVADKLQPLAEKELETLLELKKKSKEERGEEFDGKIHDWDTSFYFNQYLEKEFGIDDDFVRNYFPFSHVTEQILSTYQRILGLKFDQVENPENLWDPSVLLYRVVDSSSNQFVGHFYLDLFPREGKYSHACAYPVIDHFQFFEKEEKQNAIGVMIANFTPSTPSKPSLLTHSEVKTYCHEFGHLMHNLCSKNNFSETSWLLGGMDFIECPSQMMENFIWQKEILVQISKHYQTGESLDPSLIDKMIAAKNAGIGLSKLRQIMMGLYDLTIHLRGSSLFKEGEDASPLNHLWDEMKKRMTMVESTPNTNYVASWLHLCSDYDAGYYSYLWSEVFSSDLFSRFQEEGIFNPKVGSDYRSLVLQPASSEGGMALLSKFLGRQPNESSFLKSLGIN